MMNELTCPYCNAVVPLTVSVQAGQMVACPRCEERFKALGNVQLAPSAATAPSAPPVRSARWSNRGIALSVLGVMVLMATVATTFALLTQEKRREHDKGLPGSLTHKRPLQPEVEEGQRVSPIAPLDLDALHLLPNDLDVLTGVHVALLRQEPDGKRLLTREMAGLKGSVDTVLLKRLEAVTGIAIKNLDHVVVGIRLKEIPPAIVIAVKTRTDIEPADLVKRLRAELHPKGVAEKVYHFRRELLATHGEGLLHFEDDRTFLLAWEGKVSDVLSSKRKGEETPKAELADLLRERMKPAGPVWVVGSIDEKYGPTLSGLLALARVAEAERNALLGLRSFAFWLTLEKKLTIRGMTRSADEKSREAVEGYLRGTLGNKPDVTLIPEKDWLTLQYRPER
jgi:hypothetical protein